MERSLSEKRVRNPTAMRSCEHKMRRKSYASEDEVRRNEDDVRRNQILPRAAKIRGKFHLTGGDLHATICTPSERGTFTPACGPDTG